MKKIMSNQYVFSIFTKISLVLLGVLSSVFINRYLGPALKGEYSYLLNIINLTVLILNFGIYQSYPYFKRKYGDEMKSEYFNFIFFQFAVYMVFALAISIVLSKVQMTIILTLTPLMIFTKQLSFIALVEDINLRNKLNIGNQLFYIFILLIVFVFLPVNIIWVLAALYVKDILIIIRIIYKYNFKIEISRFDSKLFLKALKFGVFPMLSALLITMNYNIDIILLRIFVEYEEIGYYSVGVALANQVWLIPDAFKDVLFAKTSKTDAIDDIKMSIKVNLYISIIIISIVALFGKPLLVFLYGSEYLPSYTVTIVIFTGLIPMIFYKMIISLFNARGKQKISFWILLTSAIINIGLNLLLIPLYGITGAAFASVISYSVCGIAFTYLFIREFNVKVVQLFFIDRNEMLRLKKIFSK